MKAHHLKLLRDPKDLSVLRLTATRVEDGEILEGLLQSDNATYPITNGIPRFVESEGYSENFGWQWKKWSKVQYESENEGLPMDGWTENMFFTATQFQPGDILRKTVLGVGCGAEDLLTG